MPIYEFTFAPKLGGAGIIPERSPIISTDPYNYNSDLHETANKQLYDLTNRSIEDVRSILPVGFHTMDGGVKQWLSDIQVPTGDSVRPLTVRVAGGDKTFLVWQQDLRSGRIQLPVCSINRTSVKFNPEKFSPPYMAYTWRFADREGRRIIQTYRPWPALIDYTLSIWGERKRDNEYVLYQILTRCNPLGEFIVEDEHLRGAVQVRLNGSTDSSDIDIGADELAKVRYDIEITIEGWLPLPEKITPSVLGKVGVLNEIAGDFLDIIDVKDRSTVSEIGFFTDIGITER